VALCGTGAAEAGCHRHRRESRGVFKFGTEYQKYFADNGIELVVKETSGSVANYNLLTSPDSGVDIAIVQGGTAPPEKEARGA